MIWCKSNSKVKIQTLPHRKLRVDQIGLMIHDSQDCKADQTWKIKHPLFKSMSVFMYLSPYILMREYTCESNYVYTCVYG